ncbi:hypothetical protein GCM10027589_35010 [Actinocorallia lasiicapitis]
MTVRHAAVPAATGRLRAAWDSAHAPVSGVPRWARIAAYAIPFTVLPSGLWRIAAVVFEVDGDGAHGTGQLPSWLPGLGYVIALSVFSELVAFTGIGLVARWGEVFPRWIPFVGGRRVPAKAAVIPASVGAVVLTVLWTAAWVTDFAGVTLRGEPTPADFPSQAGGWEAAMYYVCYLPLLLWGPLLAVVTYAYHRRRNH